MFKLFNKIFSTPSKSEPVAADVVGNSNMPSSALTDARETAQRRGNAALSEGRLDDAASYFGQAISAAPAQIEGYINLGYVLIKLRQTDKAEHVLQQALGIDPASSDALYMLATLARERQKPAEAIEYFEKVLQVNPTFQTAYSELGQLLFQSEKINQAQTVLLKGIEHFPTVADLHFFLANVQIASGDHDAAIASLRNAVALRPQAIEIHSVLAQLLLQQNRYAESLKSFRRVTEIKPDAIDAFVMQGKILSGMGRHEDALRRFEQALAVEPDCLAALLERGAILLGLQRNDEALMNCEHVLRLAPDAPESHLNLSAALQSLQRYQEALVSSEQALAIKPDSVDGLINCGTALSGLKRHEEAITCYERALAINPNDVEGKYNQALSLLTIGNFERGLELYELRWQTLHIAATKRDFPQPLWLGKESLKGKSILLHAEQGLGDTIQFCRYATLVADRGATVYLLVPLTLASLLASLSGVSRIFTDGDVLPAFEYHCPLLSLPLAIGTTLQTIPGATPYLFASTELANRIPQIPRDDGSLRIGVCWKGGNAYRNDASRSVGFAPFQQLLSGFNRSEAKFYTLVPDSRESFGRGGGEDLGYELITHTASFEETAALITSLDLVITCDTSIGHLAGALGKPVWILLPYSPDWRWLLSRDDSPWYPSARLFRQPQSNDWKSVMDVVATEIGKLHRDRMVGAAVTKASGDRSSYRSC